VSGERRGIDAVRIERLDPEVARILRGTSGMERLRIGVGADA
jgi:hypothetical protein